MHDLLLSGATLYDGSGADGRTADVAIRDGRIAAIGRIAAPARETVNADGLALMPGIVDLHTHYDAQITWDPTLSPSSSLGVTTAVMGNCGFGIAPCPKRLRKTMMQNLSVVEGMDLTALLEGVNWEFESFPEYMEQLRRAKPYLNLAVFAGHSVTRTAVMGEEASTRAEATPAELEKMKQLVREAMQAGAIGFASSFSPNHSGYGGQPMPSTIASNDELKSLTAVLGEAGRGVFMSATGSRATPDFMESIVAENGRPAFISTVMAMYNDAFPQRGLEYYERCAQAQARGHELYIQTSCQPLCFDFTLRDPYILISHDAFDPVKKSGKDELAGIYADASFRKAFRENLAKPKADILFYGNWEQFEVGEAKLEHNRYAEGRTIAALAKEAGKDALDFFFDFSLSDNLDTSFVAKLFNNRDEGVAKLLKHPAGVLTLSDAGAHLIFMCDAGFGLHFLGHWVRDTQTFSLGEAVRKLTSDPAKKYRIPGRGVIEQGAWADLMLFDPATVGISKLERLSDLPGGGARMVRRPKGVHGVWVNGQRVFDGKDTVRLAAGPGQVLDKFDA